MGKWVDQTLDEHNKRRALHGVPPLKWSQECYKSAKKAADACQAQGKMFHNTLSGPSGRHGQNIYWCSAPGYSVKTAVDAWYREIGIYNFNKPGFTHGTGHFTQLVWKATKSVGMAKSADGKYTIANYFPGGNITSAGYFKDNVPQLIKTPVKSPIEKTVKTPIKRLIKKPIKRPIKKLIKKPTNRPSSNLSFGDGRPKPVRASAGRKVVQAKSMTPELSACFNGCPYTQYKDQVVEALKKSGTTVTCTRDGGSISIKIVTKSGQSTSSRSMSATWS
jgi:hypothetical protein